MSPAAAVRLRRFGIPAAAAVVWLAVVLAVSQWYHFEDLRLYHDAVNHWLSGGELYSNLDSNVDEAFDLSPIAAGLLIPVVTWPIPVGIALSTGLGFLALFHCVRVSFADLARSRSWPSWSMWGIATVVLVTLEPVRQALGLGQIGLLLLAVALADLAAIARRRPLGGIGLGLAVTLQPNLVLLIVFLLIIRRWRAGLIAAATVILPMLAGLLVLPQATGTYLTHVLFNPGSTGHLSDLNNQALSGLMARLYETGAGPAITWLGFALFAAAWGLTRAKDAHQRGNPLAALTVVGLTGALVSPVTWTFQLVWIIPAMAILTWWALTDPPPLHRPTLGDRTWGRWTITSLFWLWFAVSPMWWSWEGGARLITENGYVIATILLIAILPRAAHRCSEDRFGMPEIPVRESSNRE